ncbi:MAG TPA: DUF4232 domain-containing protein [Kineosporiaceae bacterium]
MIPTPGERCRRRAWRTPLPLFTLTVLLASCGPSSGGVALPTDGGTTSDTTTGSPVVSAPSSGAASPARSTAPSTAELSQAPCEASALAVTAGRVDAGAGQRYLPLIFTNTGSGPCTLRGYPGVAALDPGGRQVAQASRETGFPLQTVRLGAGGSASALVHATAVPSGTATACPGDYPALLVTPPDTTTSVRVTVALPACGGLDVRPLAPGTAGTAGT